MVTGKVGFNFLARCAETSIQAGTTARAILALKSEHEAQINQKLGNRAGRGTKLLLDCSISL